ncbi:MAG: VWA domain-containing protein [Bryobacteraceae bacterium]|nr:VWA domain-containing protein [Bryobacteraceae bacterium]
MRSVSSRVALFSLGSLAAILVAQQTPQPARNDEDIVFRVTTTLVQVDAVVTDSKGKQVTDLSPADFEVKVDGKVQPLKTFSYVRLAPEPAAAPKPREKRTANQPPNAPPPKLKRERGRSSLLLVVDDLGLSWESTAYVRQALKKFVNEQLEPDQVAAIYQTGRTSGIFQQFTNDKRLLLAAVDRLRWNPMSRGGIEATPLITPDTDTSSDYQQSLAEGSQAAASVSPYRPTGARTPPLGGSGREGFDEAQSQNYVVGTLGAVNEILTALHGLPGRKSLVLFSDGIDLSPSLRGDERVVAAARNLIEHANRSGTVIHAIDARGLQTLAFTAADNPGLTRNAGEELRNLSNRRAFEFSNSQTGLEFIAEKTGGAAFLNNNNMNWALGRVLEDQRGYYLLGFQPDSSTFQPKYGGNYHSIRVRLTRKGLQVRSRTGFFGATDEEMQPHNTTPAEQLRAAMLSPFEATDIGLRITPAYLKSTPEGPMVRNLVYVDPKDLTFETAPDGKRSASLRLLAVAAGADNRILGWKDATPVVEIPADQFDRMMREGLLLILEVQVKQPGGYQIRVALRDMVSAKVGSAGQYMDIPDLKKKRLALSSVFVDEASTAPESSRFQGIMPAKRQFRPGSVLEFFAILDNVRVKPGAGSSDVDVQVRVLREGQTVYSGPAQLTAMETDKEWAVRGLLRLKETMPWGDYYLQVIATDHAAKRNNLASTWTDFELMPE